MLTRRPEQDWQGGRAPSNPRPEVACAPQVSPSQPTAGGGLSKLKESETKKDTQPHKRCCTFNRNHYRWGVLSGEMSNALTRMFGGRNWVPVPSPSMEAPRRGSTEWAPVDLHHRVEDSTMSVLHFILCRVLFSKLPSSRCSIILKLVPLAAQHYLNPNEFLSHNVA